MHNNREKYSKHNSVKLREGGESSGTKRHISTQEISEMALLSALALALSWLESVIPFQPGLPGVKPGLPNLIIVFCLYRMNTRNAVLVNAVRILLAGLMFSGLWGMLYSACGAVCSMCVMILLLKWNDRRIANGKEEWFSIIGLSMAGGVFHNMGQLLVAILAVSNVNLFFYCPVLIISGMITGIVNGILAHLLLQKLPRQMIQN